MKQVIKKKKQKYYKIILFTKKRITIIEKKVHVNVKSHIEANGTLYINKESVGFYDNDEEEEERQLNYNLTDVSEYIAIPQKRKI